LRIFLIRARRQALWRERNHCAEPAEHTGARQLARWRMGIGKRR
jgi:hypothetical protein